MNNKRFSTRYGVRVILDVARVRENNDHLSVPSLLSSLIHTVALDMELRVEDAEDYTWCCYTELFGLLRKLYLYSIGELNGRYSDYSPMADEQDCYMMDVLGCMCPEQQEHVLQWIKQYNSAPFDWENLANLMYKVGNVCDDYISMYDLTTRAGIDDASEEACLNGSWN